MKNVLIALVLSYFDHNFSFNTDNKIEIYWINMESNLARRTSMISHLNSLNLTHFRVQAVTPLEIAVHPNAYNTCILNERIYKSFHPITLNLTHPFESQKHSESDRSLYPRVCLQELCAWSHDSGLRSNIELAVTTSHLIAIHRATHATSTSSPYAIIAEDDIEIRCDINYTALIQAAPQDFTILQLLTHSANDFYYEYLINSTLWYEHRKRDFSAGFYLIHKQRIKPIIDAIVQLQPVDSPSTQHHTSTHSSVGETSSTSSSTSSSMKSSSSSSSRQNVYNIRLVAARQYTNRTGANTICNPRYCCQPPPLSLLPGPLPRRPPHCVFVDYGFVAADWFVYALGKSYVLTVPLVNMRRGQFDHSNIHQTHVGYFDKMRGKIDHIMHLMSLGKYPVPPFITLFNQQQQQLQATIDNLMDTRRSSRSVSHFNNSYSGGVGGWGGGYIIYKTSELWTKRRENIRNTPTVASETTTPTTTTTTSLSSSSTTTTTVRASVLPVFWINMDSNPDRKNYARSHFVHDLALKSHRMRAVTPEQVFVHKSALQGCPMDTIPAYHRTLLLHTDDTYALPTTHDNGRISHYSNRTNINGHGNSAGRRSPSNYSEATFTHVTGSVTDETTMPRSIHIRRFCAWSDDRHNESLAELCCSLSHLLAIHGAIDGTLSRPVVEHMNVKPPRVVTEAMVTGISSAFDSHRYTDSSSVSTVNNNSHPSIEISPTLSPSLQESSWLDNYAIIAEDDVEVQFEVDFPALIASAPKDFGFLQLLSHNLEENFKMYVSSIGQVSGTGATSTSTSTSSIRSGGGDRGVGAKLWTIKQNRDFSTGMYIINKDALRDTIRKVVELERIQLDNDYDNINHDHDKKHSSDGNQYRWTTRLGNNNSNDNIDSSSGAHRRKSSRAINSNRLLRYSIDFIASKHYTGPANNATCIPQYCCTQTAFMKPPCIPVRHRNQAADWYIYSLAKTYVITIPVVTMRSGLFDKSAIHSRQRLIQNRYQRFAFRVVEGFRNGTYRLPPFLKNLGL